MELAVQEKSVYENALRQLLPRGSFWEKELLNPSSDISLLLAARSDALHRIRQRMADLQKESSPSTAVETLAGWERVYLGASNETLPLPIRKSLLLFSQQAGVNLAVLNQAAQEFGVGITSLSFPYAPACFAHARFGIDRLASPAAFSVIFIFVDKNLPETQQADFENLINGLLLANHIPFFFYQSQSGGQQ